MLLGRELHCAPDTRQPAAVRLLLLPPLLRASPCPVVLCTTVDVTCRLPLLSGQQHPFGSSEMRCPLESQQTAAFLEQAVRDAAPLSLSRRQHSRKGRDANPLNSRPDMV